MIDKLDLEKESKNCRGEQSVIVCCFKGVENKLNEIIEETNRQEELLEAIKGLLNI